MQDKDTQSAIAAALCCNWTAAIGCNLRIFKKDPCDIDCLNRLGKAYLESGDTKKAVLYFRKVLKLDKYNPIASKNLTRASGTPKIKPKTTSTAVNFLEEPGKTRLVALVNAASINILLKQDIADRLTLLPKRHTVVVEDSEGNYLGALPDDLGHRLGVLIKGGNKYEATIKSVAKNIVTVFLRELARSKKFHNTPSFMTTGADYLSYVREEQTETPALHDEDSDDGPVVNRHEDEEPETT